MLSGVMLIIVTMFAVLGAYYLSDLLTNCLFRRRKAAEALVVLRADTSEQMWAGVLDARAALPDTAVVVLCPQEDAFTPPGAGMRGVAFATPDTLAQVVQAQLNLQEYAPPQIRLDAEKSAVHQRKQRGKRNTREKAGSRKAGCICGAKYKPHGECRPGPSCTANRAGSAVRRQHGGEARLFRQAKE